MPSAERADAAARVHDFLRGMYPLKTAEHVAADIGGNADTIQSSIDRGTLPSGIYLGRMTCAYGPPFLCAWLGDRAPDWLDAAKREQEQKRLRAEIEALQTRLEKVSA
jgi:hypothetical protein